MAEETLVEKLRDYYSSLVMADRRKAADELERLVSELKKSEQGQVDCGLRVAELESQLADADKLAGDATSQMAENGQLMLEWKERAMAAESRLERKADG